MVDSTLLRILGKPKVIDGLDHMVAWDVRNNRAYITYVDKEGELHDLQGEDGEILTFKSELGAHVYLIELRVERHGKADTSWKNLE
jgi:hypothetical protein